MMSTMNNDFEIKTAKSDNKLVLDVLKSTQHVVRGVAVGT